MLASATMLWRGKRAPDTLRGFLFVGLLALVPSLLLWSGCAASHSLEVAGYPLQAQLHASRDGILRYRIPVGWLNAQNGSEAEKAPKAIWLVRNDFAATITVCELTLDAPVRRQIGSEGLKRVAELTMRLATEKSSHRVVKPPTALLVDGGELFAYELTDPATGDSLRVILLDTSLKVYELTALVAGEKKGATTREVYAAQESFLRGMKW